MINSIIDAVCVRLDGAFGDGYRIYTEHVEQGLQEPCFFVSCINPRNKPMVGNRYLRSNLFCIQFIPTDEEPKAQCNAVLERLYDALGLIDVEGLVMGTGMHGEIVGGVLSFFVNYDFFVRKAVQEVPAMGEMTYINTKMKG